MTVVVTRLRVPDYDRWAAQFESGESSRDAFGLKALAFGHVANDRDIAITIIEDESIDKVHALFSHPTFKENMERERIEILDTIIVER